MSNPWARRYVLDTQALIWYLTNDKQLSPLARAIIEAAETGQTQLLIPVIVLAELHFVNAKKRWFEDIQVTLREIRSKPYIRVIPLEASDIDDFDQDASIPEMHDRLIAGVARRLQAPLITSDLTIRASTIVTSVW